MRRRVQAELAWIISPSDIGMAELRLLSQVARSACKAGWTRFWSSMCA